MSLYVFGEWVAVLTGQLEQPSVDYIVIAFPTEEIRDSYLTIADERPDQEVLAILRTLLGGSRTVEPADELHLASLKARQRMTQHASSAFRLSEYDRRVISFFGGVSKTPTWEGLTWVIDLLPHWPQQAVDVVHAYLLAHAQVLPDLRITGLSDAADLIRSRYITRSAATIDTLLNVLLSLGSRDFELLVASLYRAMGYDVRVTPAQKDGGKDVVATRQNEIVYIECKNWRGRVDSDVVAGLVGRVETHRVTRGVVVGTSGFTSGRASADAVARESPARITLLSGTDLIEQLNESLGSEWHRQLERLLQRERLASGAIQSTP